MKISKLIAEARAVLFDMDGVIIDSDSLHEESKRGAVSFCGVQIKKAEWKKIKHLTSAQIYQLLCIKYPYIKTTKEEFVAEKSRIFAEIAPHKLQSIAGAFDFVQYLKNKGIDTALVTTSRKNTYEVVSHKFNLSNYFNIVLTREDVKNLKPDPECYLKAVKLLGVEPESCMIIEDSVPGVQSGKAAGCMVIGRTSAASAKILLEAGADAVFKNYKEIYSLTSF